MWKGIAIAGIWIGIGMIGMNDAGAAAMASIFATVATIGVAYSNQKEV